MPKAILALRSYPLAMVMALVLFLCSLILATNSTGIIGGGGEDSGSGMGGTGKSGMPGDSGFGGTGGPSPFLGDAGISSDEQGNTSAQDQAMWPAPWLPRETETAAIPEEIAPLLEMQRNPLRDPTLQAPDLFPNAADALAPGSLRIIEQDTSGLPSHLRQQLDLANAGEVMTESAPIEIRLQIPEIKAPDPVEMPVLQRQLETQQAQRSESAADLQDVASASGAVSSDAEIPEIVTETPEVQDPRTTTERIQRPELPPFQRMRPAVDRASVMPARPQPMRI